MFFILSLKKEHFPKNSQFGITVLFAYQSFNHINICKNVAPNIPISTQMTAPCPFILQNYFICQGELRLFFSKKLQFLQISKTFNRSFCK
jgi:hypothetical protein